MPKKPAYTFQIFADASRDWRFRYVCNRNGKTMFTSGESFYDKSGARRAVKRVQRTVPNAGIEVDDE